MSQQGEGGFVSALGWIILCIWLVAMIGAGLVCRGVRILRGQPVKPFS